MQRYKVFINQSVFYFTNSGKNLSSEELEEIDTVIDFRDITKENIYKQIEIAEQNKVAVLFIYHDLTTLWDDFMSFFDVRIAGGGLVEDNKKNYLLIFRNEIWDLPKGHIEQGETIETGSIREVEEETGISSPQLIRLITETYHTYWYGNSRVLKHTYWYYMKVTKKDNTLTPQTEEGITSVEWSSEELTNKRLSMSYSSIQDVWAEFKNQYSN